MTNAKRPSSPSTVASPGSCTTRLAVDATSPPRKRPLSPASQPLPTARRKGLKVTRACDTCKARKSRCTGTLPCDSCSRRGRAADCHYDAEYRRGYKVTPVRAEPSFPDETPSSGYSEHNTKTPSHPAGSTLAIRETMHSESPTMVRRPSDGTRPHEDVAALARDTAAPSRASPELEVAEIQGQYYDTTSGLAFLHRAFRRLSKGQGALHGKASDLPQEVENEDSPTLAVGDKPLGLNRQTTFAFPPLNRGRELVRLYFEVCMSTYRFLHIPSVDSWLEAMARNDIDGLSIFHGIGRAKAAIVLTMLAIATAHEDKASGRFHANEGASMDMTDAYFLSASALVQQETAKPTLESAQARLIQVLYLLTTSRMNQAWYVFGTAIQMISALGLHRKARAKHRQAPTTDYITEQCRIRTFWTAYILDKYLGVIFGRPVHYHDDDIDQDMPDRVNDEDMLPTGPIRATGSRGGKDCHVEALVCHATIASMVSKAARTVYSIKPISNSDRIEAANRLSVELQDWQAALPPHLGAVKPSSLIPQFRRQTITLKIANAHAIMHINRPFLLGKPMAGREERIRESILAARSVLETVDDLVSGGGTVFHAFWWTHYVTFCALAIIYAWGVQIRRANLEQVAEVDQAEILELAEKCQRHLAQATASNSPSRRYALILEKLRKEALRRNNHNFAAATSVPSSRNEPAQQQQQQQAAEYQQQQLGWKQTPPGGVPGSSSQQVLQSPQMTQSQAAGNNNTGMYPIGLQIDPNSNDQFHRAPGEDASPQSSSYGGPPLDGMNWSIQEWQGEDWLNLDSMAFGTFPDSYDTPFLWNDSETL